MNFSNTSLAKCKSVYAPLLQGIPHLSGDLGHDSWMQAGCFSDFSTYPDQIAPNHRTRICVFHDADSLYIGGQCLQKETVVLPQNRTDRSAALRGDGMEMVFGAFDPVLDLAMISIAADGSRYSCNINHSQWEAACHVNEQGWSFEVRIPFAAFHQMNYSLRFNCFRRIAATGQFLQWSPIFDSTFSLECTGEILLCDYKQAAFFRTGSLPAVENFSRADYEKCIAESCSPASGLLYTPYLTAPGKSSIDVVFLTAGRCRSAVEYREVASGKWETASDAFEGTFSHRIRLTGLLSQKEYEYRIKTWDALHREEHCDFQQTFRFFGTSPQEFSFSVLTDCHGAVQNIRKMLAVPAIHDCNLLCDCGDSVVQYNTGIPAFMESAFKVDAESCAGRIPMIGVRGNHDCYGFCESNYLKLMGTESGRSYGAFRYGDVEFILLDSGIDVKQDIRETEENVRLRDRQREFLLHLRDSDEDFRTAKYRIAFIHMTAYDHKYGSQEFLRMTDGIFDKTPEHRLHVLIGGHLHFGYLLKPDSEEFTTFGEWSFDRTSSVRLQRPPAVFPYTTFCVPGGCGVEYKKDFVSALSVRVTETCLTFQWWNVSGECIYSWKILPDGTFQEEKEQ